MKLITVELHQEGDQPQQLKWSDVTVPLTDAVDQLIQALGDMRCELPPPFPIRLPPAIESRQFIVDPAWQWGLTPDGDVVLNILHPGFGWLAFLLPDAKDVHQQMGQVLDASAQRKGEQK